MKIMLKKHVQSIWNKFFILFFLSNVSIARPAKLHYLTENFPPYSYYDEHKNLVGISADILKEILTKLELEAGFQMLPWVSAAF